MPTAAELKESLISGFPRIAEAGILYSNVKHFALNFGVTGRTISCLFRYEGLVWANEERTRVKFITPMAEGRNTTVVAEKPFSFGIEFEGRVIDANSSLKTSGGDFHARIAGGWEAKHDPTATFELASPVYTSINEAFKSVKKQFKHWNTRNPTFAPLFRGTGVGQHMHIGEPRKMLSARKKLSLTKKVIKVLPLCYYMSANSFSDGKVLSTRMTQSSYCRDNKDYFIGGSHYSEISDSSEGTVELRKFDANIPQVNLTIAAVLEQFVKNGKEIESNSSSEYMKNFNQSKLKIFKGDLVELLSYKKALEEIEMDFDKYPTSVKEVLYLTLVKMTNVSLTTGYYGFKFCRETAENPEKLFEVMEDTATSKKQKEAIKAMKAETADIKTLKEMLSIKPNLNIHQVKDLVQQIGIAVKSKKLLGFFENFDFDKSHLTRAVKEYKEQKRTEKDHPAPDFKRVTRVQRKNPERICRDIAGLIGETITPYDVRQAEDRFYVQYIKSKLAIAFSLNMPAKQFKSAFIHQRHKGKYEEAILRHLEGLGIVLNKLPNVKYFGDE